MRTIVSMKFGSHLYGTQTPSSDYDFKGVHVPNADDILLQRTKGSISVSRRPKAHGEKNQIGEIDEENFSLQKYLQLLSEGQTPALDMLFATDDMILEKSSLWDYIRENKEHLLTKKSTAFLGYCRQQANKYGIKGSRVAAAKQAAEFFGSLAKTNTLSKVEEYVHLFPSILGDHTQIVSQQINKDGDIGQFFECCNRKVGFTNTVKEAHSIFNRIYENYGARAKQAEKNEGVDWKALSHAVRVGNQAIELLNDHIFTFPRPEAKHLIDIKTGKLIYNEVAEEIEDLLVRVEEAALTSTLPDLADQEFIEELILHEYRSTVIIDALGMADEN